MKERKQRANATVKHKAISCQLKRTKVVWGGGGIEMFRPNILVYTKRQKAPHADRKHETTQK